MKKILLKGVFYSMFAFALISCSNDDEDQVDPKFDFDISENGIYVLNSGSQKSKIPASLTYFDPSKNSSKPIDDVFLNQNGIELGNGGQDLVIYGSKMYITLTESNCIYVTDKKGKLLKYSDGNNAIIKPMNSSNQPQKPRSAMAHKGKVYVSLYDGYIARIDTTTMKIDKLAALDATYPEEITIVGTNLYTVISDYKGNGTGKDVAIIDLNTFSKTGSIPVALNPTKITNDDKGNLYVISNGNYKDIPSCLQKIDVSNNYKVTELGTSVASNMEAGNDKIYLMREDYTIGKTILSYYDIATNKIVNTPFVETDKADISRAYNITKDPVTGNIYIATSDYKNEGGMHIFNSKGNYIQSLKTAGINPMGAYFMTNAKYF